jgi:hypothetical protein
LRAVRVVTGLDVAFRVGVLVTVGWSVYAARHADLVFAMVILYAWSWGLIELIGLVVELPLLTRAAPSSVRSRLIAAFATSIVRLGIGIAAVVNGGAPIRIVGAIALANAVTILVLAWRSDPVASARP